MVHNESVNVWSHLMGVILFLLLLSYTAMMLGLYPHFHMETLDQIKHTLSTNYESSINRIEVAGEDLSSNLKYHYENGIEGLEAIGTLLSAGYQEGWHKVQELCQDICPNLDSWRLSLNVTSETLSNAKDILEGEIKNKLDYLHKMVDQVCQIVVNKIDSPQFDWLDLYRPYGNMQFQHISRCKLYIGPLFIFIISAMICLGSSAICHLFNAYSRHVSSLVSRMDYAGISILIAGSYYPVIFYIFYCKELYIWLYLGGITVCSFGVFVVALSPDFQKPEFRAFRGFIFLLLGLLGVIPVAHVCMTPESKEFATALMYFCLMGATYIIGVLIYVMRVPERFYPGKFDLWGNSHNIWHFFVLSAAIWHYIGALNAYHLRQVTLCPAGI